MCQDGSPQMMEVTLAAADDREAMLSVAARSADQSAPEASGQERALTSAQTETDGVSHERRHRLAETARRLFFGRRPAVRGWLVGINFLAIAVVGWIDYATRPEISFAVFYIPLIALAAWYGGRASGIIAAFLGALAWCCADFFSTAGRPSHLPIHFWNATTRFLIYALVTVLLDLIRARRDQLAGAVQEKTALLKQEIVARARVEREVIDICAREQRRIAYDLHDNLGQRLVGIALRAKLLAEKLRPVRPREAKEISEIVRLTNEAAKQNRLTACNLDGPDGVGDLKTALQRLAADLRRNCRAKCRVKTDSRSLPVSTPVAVQLYRIAQEAVHNAVEHGDAKEVQIDLASDDKEIVLRVHDNGGGFRARAAAKGLGLRIMQYRVHCIGGSCEVQSTRATGTTVTCRVPSPFGSGVN